MFLNIVLCNIVGTDGLNAGDRASEMGLNGSYLLSLKSDMILLHSTKVAFGMFDTF